MTLRTENIWLFNSRWVWRGCLLDLFIRDRRS